MALWLSDHQLKPAQINARGVKDMDTLRARSPSGGNMFGSDAATEKTDKLWSF